MVISIVYVFNIYFKNVDYMKPAYDNLLTETSFPGLFQLPSSFFCGPWSGQLLAASVFLEEICLEL